VSGLVATGAVPSPALRDIPFLDLTGTTNAVRAEVLAGWRDMLSTGQFIGGEAVTRFESEWAGYCGTAHAIGVANGTDALHLALRGLGIGPGDDVIVPANTFVATVEAVVLAGATPRFADVDPDTGLLTADHVEAAATPTTRAMIVVHLYGQMPDMDALGVVAERQGMVLIEDAAQAQGATWRGVKAGAFGAAGCFSFYPGKNLGGFGDAGAVVTSDPELADRLRSMRDHGRVTGTHYEHDRLGTNSRLDAAQAMVLSAKLRRLDGWNAARRRLAALYRELLAGSATLVQETEGSRGVYHLMVARVHDRERVRAELAEAGIATGIHYPTPCHRMAPYQRFAGGPLPAVEQAAAEVISLPMYPHLLEADVARVCEVLAEAAKGVPGR
jgi:dTDP-4-amino-4,6-dideoxygalactose transaminase